MTSNLLTGSPRHVLQECKQPSQQLTFSAFQCIHYKQWSDKTAHTTGLGLWMTFQKWDMSYGSIITEVCGLCVTQLALAVAHILLPVISFQQNIFSGCRLFSVCKFANSCWGANFYKNICSNSSYWHDRVFVIVSAWGPGTSSPVPHLVFHKEN